MTPTKQAKWLIENFTDSEDYRDLEKAVKETGRECYVIGPRANGDFNTSFFKPDDCVIVQGSIQMTKHVKERLPSGCFPVAYNNFQNFLCSTYYPHFNEYLFNEKRAFVTLKDLKENKFEFYRKFGKEGLIFVRPDSGEKTFTGQLVDLQDFDRFWDAGTISSAKDEDLVMVSTPKQINGEYRIVCMGSVFAGVKEQIVASSTYSYQGKSCLIPSVPKGATDLVFKLLMTVHWQPDNVFCMDIAEDADGNFWLLELTSFSSAGLYATNKRDIAVKISEFTEKLYHVHNLVK